jgi:tRNA(fMet)-specific endonuclease VapC
MKFLLDTNICIYMIKKKPPQVLQKFVNHPIGEIAISSITLAELHYGIEISQHPVKNHQALAQFLIPLVIASFNEPAAAAYGKVRALLETQGALIGSPDMLIAAHILGLGMIPVTNNTKESLRVPHLYPVN